MRAAFILPQVAGEEIKQSVANEIQERSFREGVDLKTMEKQVYQDVSEPLDENLVRMQIIA